MLGVAACSGSLPDREHGTAADPQVAAYAIAGVRRSPGTVHFTGLPSLLNSTEATGPMVITTHVGTFVMPAMSTTVTGVDPATVSHAVGYSLFERRDLLSLSTATLTDFESSRLEAYASFEETLWEVRDASSGAPLGAGASFNPSGVFFQTVTAYHVPLPDMGLSAFVPGCENLACALPPGPGGEVDAGAAEREAPGFVAVPLNPLFGLGGVSGAEGAAPSAGLRY
jgi:hypothetical protein